MPIRGAIKKPVMIIGGLSYLVSVVVNSIHVDLTGDSFLARYYYCTFEPQVVGSSVFSNRPLMLVVIVTGVSLLLKLLESARKESDMFLFEVSLGTAMLLVCVPLYFKCVQLINQGCSDPVDHWPLHRNLLMSHVCVLLIIAGTAFGQMWILFHDVGKVVRRVKKNS